MTKATPEHPNPTCSTDAECAAKTEAAKKWMLAHDYTVKENNEHISPSETPIPVMIEAPKNGEIPITLDCIPGVVEVVGLGSHCNKERYDVLYHITQAMNAAAP